jgi:magnesium chelatase family protein
MYFRVFTALYSGKKGCIVELETAITPGLPGINIVGLPDRAVQESKSRVKSALVNSGFKFPLRKVTINMLPGLKEKGGTSHEAAMAVAIMGAKGYFKNGHEIFFNETLILGELDLKGSLRKIRGINGLLFLADKMNFKNAVIPYENYNKLEYFSKLNIVGIENISELLENVKTEKSRFAFFGKKNYVLQTKRSLNRVNEDFEAPAENFDLPGQLIQEYGDFSDINGQYNAKYYALISICGGHNILFTGPPGTGKTMLANRMPALMPGLTRKRYFELMSLYEMNDNNNQEDIRKIRKGIRPFRAPHYTCSTIALAGGGTFAEPGEIAYSHGGILFIDEACELKKEVLDCLRQPLTNREICISRSYMKVIYPCDIILAAATNMCPCGSRGDSQRSCTCSILKIKNYLSRFSHALLDRFDLVAIMTSSISDDHSQFIDAGDLSEFPLDSTIKLRETVKETRDIQKKRYNDMDLLNSNAPDNIFRSAAHIDKSIIETWKELSRLRQLNNRTAFRILRLARTLSDMHKKIKIDKKSLMEAFFISANKNRFYFV